MPDWKVPPKLYEESAVLLTDQTTLSSCMNSPTELQVAACPAGPALLTARPGAQRICCCYNLVVGDTVMWMGSGMQQTSLGGSPEHTKQHEHLMLACLNRLC